MEVTMNSWVARETCERNRWVRFRKRTHREGVLTGVRGRKWGKRSRFWVAGRVGGDCRENVIAAPGAASAALGFRSFGVSRSGDRRTTGRVTTASGQARTAGPAVPSGAK